MWIFVRIEINTNVIHRFVFDNVIVPITMSNCELSIFKLSNCELSIFNASRVQSFLAAPVGKPGQSAIKESCRKLLKRGKPLTSPWSSKTL